MKKELKEIEVFVAEDGKEFITKKECTDYEKNTLSILNKIQYYSSYHSPDLTEGRGYYGKTYFAVYDEDYCHLQRVLSYLIDTYKRPIEYVQGCSAIPNYGIPVEITKKIYDLREPTRIGDYFGKVNQVFISQTKVEGFPEPIWIK